MRRTLDPTQYCEGTYCSRKSHLLRQCCHDMTYVTRSVDTGIILYTYIQDLENHFDMKWHEMPQLFLQMASLFLILSGQQTGLTRQSKPLHSFINCEFGVLTMYGHLITNCALNHLSVFFCVLTLGDTWLSVDTTEYLSVCATQACML